MLLRRSQNWILILDYSFLDIVFYTIPQLTLFPRISFLRLSLRRILTWRTMARTWEQRKLGELFSEKDEKSSEMEILSVSMSKGVYPASESDRDTDPGASISKYKVVNRGDIVYNSMRLWQGAIDASMYDGIVSPAYVVTTPQEGTVSRFFSRLLRRADMLFKYRRFSQGNSKDTLTLKFDAFAKIGVAVPLTITEQENIAACFDRVDDLITLRQREHFS